MLIPDGSYRVVEGRNPGASETIQVTRQADRSLKIEGPESPLRAIIVPLDPARNDGRYIIQLQEMGHGPRDALFLLVKRRDDHFLVAVPSCDDEIAEVVQRRGGTVSRDPQSPADCNFEDRETLIQWLRSRGTNDADYTLEFARAG
jgi:hypothetical protein